MDRLLQLVLFLTIATSSYSYVHNRHEQEMPDTPPELDSDDNYPKEYIRRLLDQLNPEELQNLRSLISMHHRAGTSSSPECSTYTHTQIPHAAPDASGTYYYILQSGDYKVPKIEIDIHVCNYTKGHGCHIEEDNIHPSYVSCCVRAKEMKNLPVIPVPIKEFNQINNHMSTSKASKEKYIEKDVYIDSICACETKFPDVKYLKHNSDVCKLIDDDYNN